MTEHRTSGGAHPAGDGPATGAPAMGAPATRWLEVAVPAGVEAVEAVSEILDRVGVNGIAVEEPVRDDGVSGWAAEPTAERRGSARRRAMAASDADHRVKAYLVDGADAAAKVAQARRDLGHLQAFGLGPIGELRTRAVPDEDWLESWKATFTPIRIGRFLVRPTWSDSTSDGDAIPLVLDPGMAFGTGLHPTTQACLERLSTLEVAGKGVLDVGCGSGVLAIAAAKRGATGVTAVDTDPLAVRAAAANAVRNGVGVAMSAGSAADIAGTFDVVFANIVAPVIRRIAPDLRARLAPGGALVLAGIIAGEEVETAGAFAGLGLRVTDRDARGDWVSLVLREAAS
ncbi:MAG: 50S ribosomal protein L11 methyltransferase [Candidatus Limnocylindria bacterium]|nr:50S ribosomal protein L11 methyltransferase [Candidatus Limnocylindria bacterium]